jgi:hypothetical protein
VGVICAARTLVAARLARNPIAPPIPTSFSPISATICSTLERLAPSAMRIPISWVCLETVYAITL